MVKKKQKTKKRKPKGKRLSDALKERDDAIQEEEAADESEPSAPYERDGSEAPLDSEPPPQWDDDDESAAEDDDEIVEAKYDDEDLEDDDEDRDSAPEAAEDGDGDGDGDGDDDGDDEDYDDDDEWEEDDDAAAQMGHRRYVISGFFTLWCVCAYITGKALEMAWSWIAAKDWAFQKLPQLAALPHEGELVSRASVSLVAGGIIAGIVVGRYYVRPDIRQWADEVAEELSKVKWPNRKEIGNHTVVVIAASIVLTLYLTLLDRFWGFVTNLIYSTGA